MDRDDVLSRAITRNLHEIGLSICQRNALVGMEKAESVHGFDFFRLTYIALKNDMIAHVIKVLDKNTVATLVNGMCFIISPKVININ